MTDLEPREPRPRAGMYFDHEFQHARKVERPYAPPVQGMRSPPPPDDDDAEGLDVPTPLLWRVLLPFGLLVAMLLSLAIALGLGLLVLILGTELLRRLGLL